jgi:hypothetical protein
MTGSSRFPPVAILSCHRPLWSKVAVQPLPILCSRVVTAEQSVMAMGQVCPALLCRLGEDSGALWIGVDSSRGTLGDHAFI